MIPPLRKTLDIPETQVSIDLPDDEEHTWHTRIRCLRIGTATKYVAIDPDLHTEIVDLSNHKVILFARNSPLPPQVRGDLYHFDALTDAQ